MRLITMIRIYLLTCFGLLYLAYNASNGITVADVAGAALYASYLFPLVFLPFGVLRLVFRPRRMTGLDRPILTWSTGDKFTVAHLLRSCWIAGAIGSGKTSGAGRALAKAILECGAGIIVFGSKPEDLSMWMRWAKEAGRSADFKVFSATSQLKCNPLDAEMKAGVDTPGLVDFGTTMSEVLVRSKAGGEGARFWEMSQASQLQFSIEPIRIATGGVTPTDIRRFIAAAPRSQSCLLKPKEGELPPEYIAYRRGFHYEVMSRANQAKKTTIQEHDFEQALLFWNTTYVSHDPKTRGNIEAGLLNMLDVFLRGIVHDKLSTETNITAADLEKGAIWFVDFNVSKWGASGKFINAALKFHVQKHCLRREFKPGDRPIILWSDECQNILNSYDATFIDECRSHGAGMVFLTQSLNNFQMVMQDKNAAEALVGQFGHKIIHACDPVTAAYAVSLVGEAIQEEYGGNFTPAEKVTDRLDGKSQWTTNYSRKALPLVLGRQFMAGLRTGGHANKKRVDAYVIRSGENFRSETNCILATFDQE